MTKLECFAFVSGNKPDTTLKPDTMLNYVPKPELGNEDKTMMQQLQIEFTQALSVAGQNFFLHVAGMRLGY